MTSHARRTSLGLALLLAACGGGGKGDTCSPTTEVCNGRDDDCNGQIDEGLGIVTCGVGACLRTVPACAGGVAGTCVPGAPGTETCNGLDDDCDGTVDEGCECQVGQTQPCYSGPAETLSVGACHAGLQTCVAGQWGGCDGEQLPAAESCNGVDDDCNGQNDDGLGETSCGVGACARTVPTCEGGAATTCTPGEPSAEVCNGIDDDCDGAVDGGNPGGGAACTTGLLGACAAGTMSCVGGALECVQDLQATAEVCDGRDDDCDGVVDDGNPGGGASCATAKLGVCAAGTTACSNGAVACVQNVQPTPELCNGLDDNCDGSVDEGNPGGGTSCNTGRLGVCSPGVMSCSGGALSCLQLAQPSAEVCDGLDNDCNGVVDEGNPGGGLACSTGLLGVCAAGTTSCIGSAVRCVQNVPASAELCGNGLDDDCNGLVDESC